MARLTITCIVRRFCLDCQGASAKAVHECADVDCALWEYREAAPAAAAGLQTLSPVAVTHDVAEATSPASTGIGSVASSAFVSGVADAGSPAFASGVADAGSSAFVSPAHTSADSDKADAANAHSSRKAARRAVLRAVRRHCLLCAASRADVRTCDARECGLWSYRFGVYPETYRAVRQRFLRPKALSLF